MTNKKHRRHSGWVTPNLTVSVKELKENNLEVKEYWDDWVEHRDGFRSPFDRSQLRNKNSYYDVQKYNNKIKLLEQRRKAKKYRLNKKQ